VGHGGGDGGHHGDGNPSATAQPTETTGGNEPEQGDPDNSGSSSILSDPSLTSTSPTTGNTAAIAPSANDLAVSHGVSTSAAVTIAVGIIVLLLLAFFGFFLWKRHQWHRKEWARRRTLLGYRYQSRSRTPSPPGFRASPPPPQSYRSGGRPRTLDPIHGGFRVTTPNHGVEGSQEGLVFAENRY
jgi:hypothetical protein